MDIIKAIIAAILLLLSTLLGLQVAREETPSSVAGDGSIQEYVRVTYPYIDIQQDGTVTFDRQGAERAGVSPKALQFAGSIVEEVARVKSEQQTGNRVRAQVNPGFPTSIYISDVIVASPRDPLNYEAGGVRILLTRKGLDVCYWWDGAWALATFALTSWESQTGLRWPNQWRSHRSVAWEIRAHCFWFRSRTLTRHTTIGFSGW